MKTHIIAMLAVLLILAGASSTAGATTYFYYDAEDGTVGDPLPNPETGGGPNFWPCCPDEAKRGTVQSSGGAAQGLRYFQWQTVDNQGDAYNTVRDRATFNITSLQGRTFYLAHFERFDRIDGRDVWHECTSCQSADKGVELEGAGVRWLVGRGQWTNHAANQDHRWTLLAGNPTYHMNRDVAGCPVLEVHDNYLQNSSGYGPGNPIQLDYERWYAVVMQVTMNTFTGGTPNANGTFRVWLDGEIVYDYSGICTLANENGFIEQISIGGTIAQGAYDAPAHLRKFDRLLLTDNWQDIVDGGYLRSPGNGDSLAPAAPTNLTVQ